MKSLNRLHGIEVHIVRMTSRYEPLSPSGSCTVNRIRV